MAQKTYSVSYRSGHFFNNLNFLQQVYGKLYLPYMLYEMVHVAYFVTLFFKCFQLHVHSFKYLKTNTPNVHLIIKYVPSRMRRRNKYAPRKTDKAPSFHFLSLEQGLLLGLSSCTKKVPLCISFFNLTKNCFIKAAVLDEIRSPLYKKKDTKELLFFVKALLFFKGGSFFLVRILSKKLHNLRTRAERKRQGILLLFIKLLFLYLLKYNLVFIKGVKFSLKGRLNGSKRKRKWIFSKGIMSLSRLDSSVDFSFCPCQTFHGSFGLKVWVHYGNIKC